MANFEDENRKRIADYYKDVADRASRKKQTPSERRLANANLGQSSEDIAPNFKSKRARSDGSLQVSVDEPKKQSFSDAFKEARKAGKDAFTFNGKSYTTEVADEKAKSKPTPTGNIGKREMLEEGETAPAFKKGGKVGSASKRADGCAIRGKTRA